MKTIDKLEETLMERMLQAMMHCDDPVEMWKMLERYDKLCTAHAKRISAQK